MVGQPGDPSGSTIEVTGAGASASRRRRRLPRAIVVVAALVLLAAAAVGGWVWNHTRTASASTLVPITYTVQPTTLQQTVTTTGTFAPAVQDNLSFPASGTVTAVKVRVGQSVTKGQLLATQDTSALSAAVTSAQATLDAANSQLSSLQANSSTTATQLSAAQAAVASDQAKLTQAQQNLAGATMTSPIAGVVAQVNLTAGTTAAGASSTTGSGTGAGSGSGGSGNSGGGSGNGASGTSGEIVVVDTSSWLVNATVGAADLPSLRSGLQATMNLAAATSGTTDTTQNRFAGGGFGGGFGGLGGFARRTVPSTGNNSAPSGTGSAVTAPTAQQLVFGTVQSVSEIASTSTGSAAFPVVIQVTGSPKDVYIGSTASVSILVKQLANVIAVPTLAVSTAGGHATVEVQTTGGGTTQRQVTLGQVFGQQTEVTQGLAAGDVVVLGTRPAAFGGRGTGGGYGGRFARAGAAGASASPGGR
ncbi:MAG TPA: biotin/lipoyl-binding protein [Propionibacteriaceae bacterium]|nr:biotin/lipoyl-binding protein [Propionibacteriaceae bacterium]